MSILKIDDKSRVFIKTELWKSVKIVSDDYSSPEPEIVARLVYYLPQTINNKISKVFKRCKLNLTSGGVFVHLRPLVKYANMPEPSLKSVEIGDLLFLRTYKKLNGSIERTALLLQAKKSDKFPPIPDNQNQWTLYRYWPEFEYAQPKSSRGVKRKVTGPGLYSGAKYLILNDGAMQVLVRSKHISTKCMCSWSKRNCINSVAVAQPTHPKLSDFKCFVDELYLFLLGKAGRSFIYQPPFKNNNWDQVITDLIKKVAPMPSRCMKINPEGERGTGVLSYFAVGDLSGLLKNQMRTTPSAYIDYNNDRKPPDVPDKWGEEGDGISVIEFNVTEME